MSFDPTKPVQTRDGREVKILETDAPGPYPIFGRYEHLPGNWVSVRWHGNGIWALNPCDLDLVNIPREFDVTFHGVVLENSDGAPYLHSVWPTPEAAQSEARGRIRAGHKVLAVVSRAFTAKEGEGL